jgi:hypothetical protein
LALVVVVLVVVELLLDGGLHALHAVRISGR